MTAKTSMLLSDEAYHAINSYAEAAGISPERAASEAIMKWMDSTGEPVMHELKKRREAKLTLL